MAGLGLLVLCAVVLCVFFFTQFLCFVTVYFGPPFKNHVNIKKLHWYWVWIVGLLALGLHGTRRPCVVVSLSPSLSFISTISRFAALMDANAPSLSLEI